VPTLILQLKAPLQSWGVAEEGVRRATGDHPSRSGVLGLLSNAMGMSFGDDLSIWEPLRMGTRVDAPGARLADYHTALAEGDANPSVTLRTYLSDAAFLVALEGPDDLVGRAAAALRSPARTLFLGRKSCPPSVPVLAEVSDDDLDTVLRTYPWLVGHKWLGTDRQWRAHARKWTSEEVSLDTYVETATLGRGSALIRDVPLSWATGDRRYGHRIVTKSRVPLPNPFYVPSADEDHDPMSDLSQDMDHDPMSGMDSDLVTAPSGADHDPMSGL
jgi:CRISPR system Cascade subunit CasD